MEEKKLGHTDISIIRYAGGAEEDLKLSYDYCADMSCRIQRIEVSGEDRIQSLNKGIKSSEGQWILILDEGESMDKRMMLSMLETVKLQETELCICGFLEEEASGRVEKHCLEIELSADRESFINAVFSELMKKGLLSCLGNKLFKGSLLRSMETLFREDMLENNELESCLRYIGGCESISLIRQPFMRKEHMADETVLADPMAFPYLLKAYNELFDSLDIDDDVINEINNDMVGLLMASLKKAYQAEEISETEKHELLTELLNCEDVQELFVQTTPEGLAASALRFMARHGKTELIHRLLMREKPRPGISLGHRQPLSNMASAEEPKAETVETETAELKEETADEQSRISDKELDEIGRQLEEGLEDF